MRHTFPSRWKAKKLNQLGFVGRGRSRHRPRNEPSLYGGESPFFQTGDIKAANLYLHKYSQTYNDKGLAQSKQWEPGTLCITIAANIADTAILGIRGCFPDSVIGFIADPEKADVHFIKYYIDLIKLEMQQVSHGTTQDNLSLDKLLRFDFVTPDVDEQRKIAAILSAYDNLIENNLQRIKILEDMVQNLYREWFVKFRFRGYQQVRFTDSPLGRIPEGWEVTTLGDHLIALESGKRPKGGAKDLKFGIPSVGAENIFGIGRHNYQSEKYVSRDFFEGMRKGVVKDGDVALYKDGAYIGRSAYFRDSFPHAQFCVNEHVFLLRTTGKRLTQNILYLWLQEPATVANMRATNANAAQPGINQAGVNGLSLVVPPLDIAGLFDELAEPSLALIVSLSKRNEALRRTRDLMLPRLISGEVDVSVLDIAVPEEDTTA
jgi:type I restriction enzyme S subunit